MVFAEVESTQDEGIFQEKRWRTTPASHGIMETLHLVYGMPMRSAHGGWLGGSFAAAALSAYCIHLLWGNVETGGFATAPTC